MPVFFTPVNRPASSTTWPLEKVCRPLKLIKQWQLLISFSDWFHRKFPERLLWWKLVAGLKREVFINKLSGQLHGVLFLNRDICTRPLSVHSTQLCSCPLPLSPEFFQESRRTNTEKIKVEFRPARATLTCLPSGWEDTAAKARCDAGGRCAPVSPWWRYCNHQVMSGICRQSWTQRGSR